MAKATSPKQPVPERPEDNDTLKQQTDEPIREPQGDGEEGEDPPPGATRPVKPPPLP